MIKIMVDEAYAFDMLAILQIKAVKSKVDGDTFVDFCQQLVNELGLDKVNTVIESDEYINVLLVNEDVFNLIEEVVEDAKSNSSYIQAIDVHNANMKRFHAKKALQEKFFTSGLTERKTVE